MEEAVVDSRFSCWLYFHNCIIFFFFFLLVGEMELSEVKKIRIYFIAWKWRPKSKNVSHSLCCRIHYTQGAGTEEGQLPFRLFHGAKSLIFRCRFRAQTARCSTPSGLWGSLPNSFSVLGQSQNLNPQLKVESKVSKPIKSQYHPSRSFILLPATWIIENDWKKVRVFFFPSEISGKLYKTCSFL